MRRLRACMVAPTKIIAGLGMSLGIEVLAVEGATGDYRTQFHRKAEAVAQALTTGALAWVEGARKVHGRLTNPKELPGI